MHWPQASPSFPELLEGVTCSKIGWQSPHNNFHGHLVTEILQFEIKVLLGGNFVTISNVGLPPPHPLGAYVGLIHCLIQCFFTWVNHYIWSLENGCWPWNPNSSNMAWTINACLAIALGENTQNQRQISTKFWNSLNFKSIFCDQMFVVMLSWFS